MNDSDCFLKTKMYKLRMLFFPFLRGLNAICRKGREIIWFNQIANRLSGSGGPSCTCETSL